MMKTLILSALLLAMFSVVVSAQVKSVTAGNQPPPPQNQSSLTRARVLKEDTKQIGPRNPGLKAHATSDSAVRNDVARLRRATTATQTTAEAALPPRDVNRSTNPKSAGNNAPSMNSSGSFTRVSLASTQIYRVGPSDVLDIQLAGKLSRKSTLFTVRDNGLLEYPLAGDPIAVAGLTTAEISGVLRQRLKILDNPAVLVNVRDYASHAVTITGFVAAPGKKTLRREAVPLYALLAESLVLPEAARATITRKGRGPIVADLKDSNHSATLVVSGDVIKVSGQAPGPSEFYFTGGAISSPGQKPYHAGLTLTQAILASGGTSTKAVRRVRVSRVGPNGRLINEEHDLRKIQDGRVADPILQKNDRIEVIPRN